MQEKNIIRNQIDVENQIDVYLKTVFLNIIKDLLINGLKNGYNKIESIKLILENKVIFSDFIKTALPKIIRDLFKKGLDEDKYKLDLFK